MKILKDEKIIERLLNKGVGEIFPSKEQLHKELLSGRRLRVYQGFDPSGPDLHLGHAVAMRKLEDFRKLGHEVFFLIGDFTAMIGDPDKLEARKKLSRDEVLTNLKNYKQQASKIIDIDNKENPITTVFNHSWLSKLTFEQIAEIASYFTVQQMIKRDMFQKRLKENKPIYINEFLYPLMQGYDSVHLNVDVEVCGHDQIFNALAGRHLAMEIAGKNKFVLAGKMFALEDGKKMGKTEGNMIKLNSKPNDIFGKIMSFSDDKIIEGFELLTNKQIHEIKGYKEEMKLPNVNPMDIKKELAFTITAELSSKSEAEKAQEYFEKVFQKKEFNTEIEKKIVDKRQVDILTLMTDTNIAQSKAQARRFVEQSAVKLDNQKIQDIKFLVNLDEPKILKVGKKIIKIIRS